MEPELALYLRLGLLSAHGATRFSSIRRGRIVTCSPQISRASITCGRQQVTIDQCWYPDLFNIASLALSLCHVNGYVMHSITLIIILFPLIPPSLLSYPSRTTPHYYLIPLIPPSLLSYPSRTTPIIILSPSYHRHYHFIPAYHPQYYLIHHNTLIIISSPSYHPLYYLIPLIPPPLLSHPHLTTHIIILSPSYHPHYYLIPLIPPPLLSHPHLTTLIIILFLHISPSHHLRLHVFLAVS